MKRLSFIVMAVIAFSLMGCQKEKLIILSMTSKTMHHGETYMISAQCDNPITYTSANEYHAKVSSSGLITAQYVGNTTIRLTSDDDSKTFSVTVSPISNLYPEPNIKLGDTRGAVISKLGQPDATTTDGIGYNNYSEKAPMLAVLFDASNRVKGYGIMVLSAYSSELSTFIRERYAYVTMSGSSPIFINSLTAAGATLIVGYEYYNTNYWMVTYLPYSGKDSLGLSEIKAVFNALEN